MSNKTQTKKNLIEEIDEKKLELKGEVKEDLEEFRKEIRRKKKKIIAKNEVEVRQEELLRKYYEFDDDQEFVTLQFYYEKASDLFDNTKYHEKASFFSNTVLSYISDTIERIPRHYDIEIELYIDDYEDYTAKEISEAFHDGLEMTHYRAINATRHRWVIVSLLLIAGLALLTTVGFGSYYEIWSKSTALSVVNEVVDIAGWVFIWQGVTFAFIDKLDLPVKTNLFKKNIVSINFRDKKDKLVYVDDTKKAMSKWISEKTDLKISKILMLICGTFFMIYSSYRIIDTIFETVLLVGQNQAEPDTLSMILMFEGLLMFLSVLEFIAGFGGVMIYKGKSKFILFVGIEGVVTFTFQVISIALMIANPKLFGNVEPKNFIITLFIGLFFVGFVIYAHYNRKRRKLLNEKIVSSKKL